MRFSLILIILSLLIIGLNLFFIRVNLIGFLGIICFFLGVNIYLKENPLVTTKPRTDDEYETKIKEAQIQLMHNQRK